MLRGIASFRASTSKNAYQQCMKLSSTSKLSAAAPEPNTEPPILYTGVSIELEMYLFILFWIEVPFVFVVLLILVQTVVMQ